MGPILEFDEEMSRQVEATYTSADVVEQRRVIVDLLDLQSGQNVLDIGSGPGFLATEMAAAVAPDGSVHGADPSEHMRALAARRQPPAGSAPVTFGDGVATALPFPDSSFDVVTSTQVYEYVADLHGALAEAHRVLRPGGRLLVLDTDWASIVWNSSDQARMHRVLTAWDEHLAHPHLPRRLTGLLEDAGFTISQVRVIPLLNTRYAPDTYGAGLMAFISSFVPGHGVTADEATAWAEDLRSLGRDYFLSVNRYAFLAVK
jgi:arsenite methyltransferase